MSYIKKMSEVEQETKYGKYESKKLGDSIGRLLSGLEKFEEDNELSKTEHKGLTELFGKIFDIVYRGNSKLSFRNLITHSNDYKKTEVENFLFEDYPVVVTGLNKYSKNLNKLNLSNETDNTKRIVNIAMEVTNELLAIRERVVSLKEYIVKKKSSVIKKEEEVARIGSHKDVLKAREYLGGTIDQYKEGILEQGRDSVSRRYAKIKSALIEDGMERKESRRTNEAAQFDFSVSQILKVAELNNGHFQFKDEKILNEQIDEEALEIYDHLKAFYVSRVSSKVAFILNHKDNLNSIEVLNFDVSHEIEALLKFKFNDNSEFNLSTKVEWVNSYSGDKDEFIRVPTRFHSVVTPDGVTHTANLSQKVAQDLYLIEYPSDIENYLKDKSKNIQPVKKMKM